jgi:hypothetical protein
MLLVVSKQTGRSRRCEPDAAHRAVRSFSINLYAALRRELGRDAKLLEWLLL